MSTYTTSKSLSSEQSEKFRDLARELECDEDEEAFDEKLKRIAKAPKAEPKPD